MNKVMILELTLHQQLVGYLAGFPDGKNVLLFSESFRANIE